MKLKLLSLLLILGLMVNTVGCTSSNDESTDVEAAEADSELEGEEVADVDAEEGSEEVSEEATEGEEVAEEGAAESEEIAEEADDFASDEEVVADTGEEEAAEEGAAEESAPSTDVAASEELPADSMEDSSALVAEDGTGTEGTELADGSVSESAPVEETGSFDAAASETPADSMASSDAGYSEAPKMIPVKKIADAPFNKNGMLLNTVYIARQGDDMSSISQKIFGGDQTSALLQANPNLSNGVKVGDKVYYNSPKRPQDAERMLTYYEDSGVAPQSYVAKSGDNIRVISKNLLGDQGSWKEVWATNMAVDSKDELAEGTELRYWPEGAVAAAPTMAEAAPAPAAPETPQMPEPTPEAPVAANDPAAAGAPQDDFALPDDMANSGAAAGTVAVEPPPPPPPPPAAPQKSVASNDEKDLTFMLSAGGLLLVGVGVLLGIIRKGRSRKMSMNTHTQI